MNKQQKGMREFINCICEKDYSKARNTLETVVNEKIKQRIRKMASQKAS